MKCEDCPYYVKHNNYEGFYIASARNIVEPSDKTCKDMNDDLDR